VVFSSVLFRMERVRKFFKSYIFQAETILAEIRNRSCIHQNWTCLRLSSNNDTRKMTYAIMRICRFLCFCCFFFNLVQIFYSQSLSEKKSMIHGDLRDETLADNKILYNSFFF